MWVKGTPCCTSSLIVVARRTSSQQRSSSGWPYQQCCTHNPTPLDGSAKEVISASANSVDCRMDIKPFKDEVLCDVAPLEVCDVLLGQPYLWKRHAVYESRPHSVIITLNRKLYRIPEAVPPSVISLISAKQCRKVISQMGKFVFFMIHSQNKRNITATSRVSVADLSTQQKQVDKVVEEYSDIFSSPTGVPLHCQVKHPIDLTPDAPLPNGTVYHHSLLENEEIK
jgi:hypothetical protein